MRPTKVHSCVVLLSSSLFGKTKKAEGPTNFYAVVGATYASSTKHKAYYSGIQYFVGLDMSSEGTWVSKYNFVTIKSVGSVWLFA